jgi:Spy/CpxP family protein refolding chaperone
MNQIRTLLSVACVVATLGGIAVASAATQPTAPIPAPNPAPMRHGWHDGPGGPGGGMHRILDELSLTTEQTTAIHEIIAKTRPQMQAVHESGRANREQLETTPPTDPAYPGLVASAKTNAAEQIQLMSDMWTQVYAKLTPDQRARIPGIVAAQRADRGSRGPGPGQPPASP